MFEESEEENKLCFCMWKRGGWGASLC